MTSHDIPNLGELRRLASSAMLDSSVPASDRDLVITAQDLNWLLDHIEAASETSARPVALVGVPVGATLALDIIYPNTTQLDGYRYTPIYRYEDHPDTLRSPGLRL